MGRMKEFAMQVSYEMGYDGEINKMVSDEGTRRMKDPKYMEQWCKSKSEHRRLIHQLGLNENTNSERSPSRNDGEGSADKDN